MQTTTTEALIAELHRIPENGKAEIVHGRIMRMAPAGFGHGRISYRLCRALTQYEAEYGAGFALPDNVGFLVDLPNRKSFSPDAAYVWEWPEDPEGFYRGAPVFAAEIRSEHDYGATADREYREKRSDYFAAGTLVVWDVNPRERIIYAYRYDRLDEPAVFAVGQVADAEPALPGWRVGVDEVFAV